MTTRARPNSVPLRLLSILLAVLALGAGLSKVAGTELAVQSFAKWGYPDWARFVTGIVEVVAALLLVVPRWAFFGASALVPIMASATFAHLFRASDEDDKALFTATLLGLCAMLAWVGRPDGLRRKPVIAQTPGSSTQHRPGQGNRAR